MAKPPDETRGAKTGDAIYLYECALAELLAEGIADDVRPQLQKFRDAPAALGEACERLPPAVLARLAKTFLPEGDDVLRSPALAQALREFKESLDETPTPRALQRRRDKSWFPAVGDACEGRYKAAVDGKSQRKDWIACEIIEKHGDGEIARFKVRYDDDGGRG